MDSGHQNLKNFALALSKKVNKGVDVMEEQLDDTIGMAKKWDLSDTLVGLGDLLQVSFRFKLRLFKLTRFSNNLALHCL